MSFLYFQKKIILISVKSCEFFRKHYFDLVRYVSLISKVSRTHHWENVEAFVSFQWLVIDATSTNKSTFTPRLGKLGNIKGVSIQTSENLVKHQCNYTNESKIQTHKWYGKREALPQQVGWDSIVPRITYSAVIDFERGLGVRWQLLLLVTDVDPAVLHGRLLCTSTQHSAYTSQGQPTNSWQGIAEQRFVRYRREKLIETEATKHAGRRGDWGKLKSDARLKTRVVMETSWGARAKKQ